MSVPSYEDRFIVLSRVASFQYHQILFRRELRACQGFGPTSIRDSIVSVLVIYENTARISSFLRIRRHRGVTRSL